MISDDHSERRRSSTECPGFPGVCFRVLTAAKLSLPDVSFSFPNGDVSVLIASAKKEYLKMPAAIILKKEVMVVVYEPPFRREVCRTCLSRRKRINKTVVKIYGISLCAND